MEDNKKKKEEETSDELNDIDVVQDIQEIAAKHNPKLGEIYKRFHNFEEE